MINDKATVIFISFESSVYNCTMNVYTVYSCAVSVYVLLAPKRYIPSVKEVMTNFIIVQKVLNPFI